MKIGVLNENSQGEPRAAQIPSFVHRLIKLGAEVEAETGLGFQCCFKDHDFEKAGAKMVKNREEILSGCDIILRIRKPQISEIKLLKKESIHISFLDPFREKEMIAAFAASDVTSVSLEMIPRTTKAQKMDVLSSQASLAGYVAVLLAVQRLNKVVPMMMTPAGTISPANVFVIGVGVAGLQAIATAKRLGARVEAFDTRPDIEEQVISLGAKFVTVDLGETSQTQEGYATALTEAQLAKQRNAMSEHCANSDIVITTAQVFGKTAPRIVTDQMIRNMRPGSLIVDLAVETGGNVEGSVVNQEINRHGVKIIGPSNLPGHVPVHASQLLAANLYYFIEEFWDQQTRQFQLDFSNEILSGCVMTHQGKIVNKSVG